MDKAGECVESCQRPCNTITSSRAIVNISQLSSHEFPSAGLDHEHVAILDVSWHHHRCAVGRLRNLQLLTVNSVVLAARPGVPHRHLHRVWKASREYFVAEAVYSYSDAVAQERRRVSQQAGCQLYLLANESVRDAAAAAALSVACLLERVWVHDNHFAALCKQKRVLLLLHSDALDRVARTETLRALGARPQVTSFQLYCSAERATVCAREHH